MKKLYILLFTILISTLSFGQRINEFEPNAAGTEPANISLELKGTPGASFTGYFLSIESDGNNGLVDRSSDVSGTFDSNGLLNVSIPDLENPSFTVVLCSENVAVGTDLDTNNDGNPDNSVVLGTVYDAIGVPDNEADALTLYGADLSGVDFPFLGNEPEIVFRDGTTDALYAKNTLAGSEIYDILGSDISALGSFDIPTTSTTFGTVNPSFTLATGPVILTGTFSGILGYETGNGPSGEGTFTVGGTNLTDDILVTAPTDFEISETSGGTFTQSITLAEGGTSEVAETIIYVRLQASLAINSYSGDITLTSAGADPKTVAITGSVYAPPTNNLVLTGAYDGPLTGGTPKGIELYALQDIPDLSKFGISSVSNGGGSSAGNVEYTFPADAVSAGTYIWLATEAPQFTTFFGFSPTYTNDVVGINGDDSIELYENGVIIDTFGTVDCDPNASGSLCPEWDHLDGWGYRNDDTGPDGTFVLANWFFSGPNALDGESLNSTATTPFPIGTYANTLSLNQFEVNNFKLYPNPTNTGFVNLSSKNNSKMSVRVFDLLGKQVLDKTISNNTLDVSGFTSGVYIIKVSQDNATITKKLVIQ
jgi:hypothetical protein